MAVSARVSNSEKNGVFIVWKIVSVLHCHPHKSVSRTLFKSFLAGRLLQTCCYCDTGTSSTGASPIRICVDRSSLAEWENWKEPRLGRILVIVWLAVGRRCSESNGLTASTSSCASGTSSIPVSAVPDPAQPRPTCALASASCHYATHSALHDAL
ncbi:hypothetical protein BT96DRAFT_1004324 [Gymnopus androsaceus JB14]|uniref:Uncharacterized protein n=1 Tax=Gymnopus androsaceus JB14 TaxID=1447944 RepID=A0A6A4GR97_9AGAR|nr:hypothetical protein BT96DRAFT_1004324 [Gymnopus androsaceus JB14]